MPTLIQYRQPLPTTIFTAGIAAFVVWVLANYITGTDFLWIRVTYAVALTLLAPALLEPIAAAITNSPDDFNLRVLFGALNAYLFCLFAIIIFFGYIQYASPITKMGLGACALVIAIYTAVTPPKVSAATVKAYKKYTGNDTEIALWFLTFYGIPLITFISIRKILSAEFLTVPDFTDINVVLFLLFVFIAGPVSKFPLDNSRLENIFKIGSKASINKKLLLPSCALFAIYMIT